MNLNHESVFIYPTDTVWGIGGSIYSQNAHKKIASIKKTSEDKPLSIMFTSIEVLHESFKLPKSMDKQWLRKYFQLESTLGILRNKALIDIPDWVTGTSDIISIRCLEVEELQEISNELMAPFFTTSLNLTGAPPIITYEEAKLFQKNYAPDASFFGEESHNLSGRSSTIVFFRDNEFNIIREGLKIHEIREHLKLTGFSIS